MKKGQAMILILIGILMVAVILGVIFLKYSIGGESSGPEVDMYKNYMQGCIEDEAKKTLLEFAKNPRFEEENTVFFMNEERNLETKDEMLGYVEREMKKSVRKCAKNFGEKKEEYEVDVGENGEAIVRLEEKSVIFETEQDVSIRKEGKNYRVKELKDTVVDIRLRAYLDTVEDIVKEQGDNPEEICIDCITGFAEENDVYVNISLTENERGLIFRIYDDSSYIGKERYILNFVMEYEDA